MRFFFAVPFSLSLFLPSLRPSISPFITPRSLSPRSLSSFSFSSFSHSLSCSLFLSLSLSLSLSLLLTPSHSSLPLSLSAIEGKTSFFRILAGLWEVPKKEGSFISIPTLRDLALVPQKPYCVEGTLADLVTYPTILKSRSIEEEERIVKALQCAGIGYLVSRFDKGLDTKSDRWDATLSLGEQQRMQICRVIFHAPSFVVLDEATDAVSQECEKELYGVLYANGMTTLTISKRLSLPEYHTHRLMLGVPPNGWQWERLTAHGSDGSEAK